VSRVSVHRFGALVACAALCIGALSAPAAFAVPIGSSNTPVLYPGTTVKTGQVVTLTAGDTACIGADGAKAILTPGGGAATNLIDSSGNFTVTFAFTAAGPVTVTTVCYGPGYYGTAFDVLVSFPSVTVTVLQPTAKAASKALTYSATVMQTITGTGFTPGKWVNLTLNSTPVNMGNKPVPASGTVTWTFKLSDPLNTGSTANALTPGPHSGVLTELNSDDPSIADMTGIKLTAPFTVNAPSATSGSPGMPRLGSDVV